MVNLDEENIKYLVYSTDTHQYKVRDVKLEALKEKGPLNLQKHIQKNLKLKEDTSTGELWEESWKAIFKKIIEN